MRQSTLSLELEIARDALVLVEGGLSERFAIARVAGSNPLFRRHQSRALGLLLRTVSQLDLIDKIVQSALPGGVGNRRQRSLARLITSLFLVQPGILSSRDGLRSLRASGPAEMRPEMEYLLGFLAAFDLERVYDGLSEVERVALQTHHPSWWVEYCIQHFGRGDAVRLLRSRPRPRYVRVNPLRTKGRGGLPAEAKRLSDSLLPVDSLPGVFVLSDSPSKLSPLFEKGIFQLQDLASYLAVKAGDPRPGEKVLDLCAAPGTKTSVLAQSMRNRGKIVSIDYSRQRMASWKRETGRLGVRIASPLIEDATRLGLRGAFDLALVDPPCSGTGVLDRNPRMKWHLTQRLVEKYSQLQYRMLEQASDHVVPTGRILYCTCSLTVEENEEVVSRFMQNHPEFETRPILDGLGSPGLRGLSDCRRFYPHRDLTAGYFIARLERLS